jgi:hypothetical protein
VALLGKEAKKTRIRRSVILFDLRDLILIYPIEGEAQVRASTTTDHPNRTEKAQASRTKCRGEATSNLSYSSMQTTVSEDAESP